MSFLVLGVLVFLGFFCCCLVLFFIFWVGRRMGGWSNGGGKFINIFLLITSKLVLQTHLHKIYTPR